MSVELLDKTRKINKLLNNTDSHKVVFSDICRVLSDILDSNVMVLSRKGKMLGIKNRQDIPAISQLLAEKIGDYIEDALNERLLNILSTKENANLETMGFNGKEISSCLSVVSPIAVAGERLGTLFLYKRGDSYSIDDIILCEYGTTVVGLEMLRSVNEESAEEVRKLNIVKSAINTLSFSELEAIILIFDELSGREGVLVASRIADRAGITRSVVVNALRKFESAGVIEARSSGMRGTSIKVLNELVYDELKKLKEEKA